MAHRTTWLRSDFVDIFFEVCYSNEASSEGDWSSGMTEVSKTFSGSSILSSPVVKSLESIVSIRSFKAFCNYKANGRRIIAIPNTANAAPPTFIDRQ